MNQADSRRKKVRRLSRLDQARAKRNEREEFTPEELTAFNDRAFDIGAQFQSRLRQGLVRLRGALINRRRGAEDLRATSAQAQAQAGGSGLASGGSRQRAVLGQTRATDQRLAEDLLVSQASISAGNAEAKSTRDRANRLNLRDLRSGQYQPK